MSKAKNNRYQIKSNIKDYLNNDYLRRKAIYEYETKSKYFRVMYFEEVAKYCGISASTVSQMKERNLQPSYIVAIKMSEFLNVPVTDLWEVEELEK